MKKRFSIFLSLILVFIFASCKKNDFEDENVIRQDNIIVYFEFEDEVDSLKEKLEIAMACDEYKIEALKPYKEEDLNFSDKDSRINYELEHSDSRPEIANLKILNRYKNIFMLFSIDYVDIPRIYYTFIESQDFTGANIFPVVTHPSVSCTFDDDFKTGNVYPLKKFDERTVRQDEVTSWVNSLRLSQL